MRKFEIPWGWLFAAALVAGFWFSGGREVVLDKIQNFSLFPQAPGQTAPQPTAEYQPAPPDPAKNEPGMDFFEYIESNVPEEEKVRVRLMDLFSLDAIKANRYFNEAVYIGANTEVTALAAQRARAVNTYSAIVYPTNFFTDLIGIDGQVIGGAEISTVVAGDVFLVVGTTPGHGLAGITDIQVEGNKVIITAHIPMEALYQGLAVAEETSNPQLEGAAVSTPTVGADFFLTARSRMPDESTLNNWAVKVAAREAMWLILHDNGETMWTEFKTSVENPGTAKASVYDILVPYIKSAFCAKLADYQAQLQVEGKTVVLQSCGTDVEIEVILIADKPKDDSGQEGVQFMRMARSGAFVQLPDPSFTVIP